MAIHEMTARQQMAIQRLDQLEVRLFALANDYANEAANHRLDPYLYGYFEGKRDALRFASKHLHEAMVEL